MATHIHSRLIRVSMRATILALLFMGAGSVAHAASVKTTPSSRDLTQQQWRAQQLIAADKSDAIMRDAQKQQGLLAQYGHMQIAYDSNRDRAFQLIFGQYLSWYQTYVGNYNGARSTFSIAQPTQADDGPSPLSGPWQARPAADVILEMAKDRQAVFFNEAHSAPLTRTLTIQLLAKLREQGFTHFAAETLYETDKDLNKRKYPTAASGFYVNEPLYGEMVRTALRLGYRHVLNSVPGANFGWQQGHYLERIAVTQHLPLQAFASLVQWRGLRPRANKARFALLAWGKRALGTQRYERLRARLIGR